jgi:hypothetical protein
MLADIEQQKTSEDKYHERKAATDPSYIYGDNKSAITNLTTPESTLANKKNNAICYHAIRESIATGVSHY